MWSRMCRRHTVTVSSFLFVSFGRGEETHFSQFPCTYLHPKSRYSENLGKFLEFPEIKGRFACGLMNKTPQIPPSSAVEFPPEPLHIWLWEKSRRKKTSQSEIFDVCRISHCSLNRFTSTLTPSSGWVSLVEIDLAWRGLLHKSARTQIFCFW